MPDNARMLTGNPRTLLRALCGVASATLAHCPPLGHCACGASLGPSSETARGIRMVSRQIRLLCNSLHGEDAEDLRVLFVAALAHREEGAAVARCVGCFERETAPAEYGVLWHAIETAPPEIANVSQILQAAAELGEGLAALKEPGSGSALRLFERAERLRLRAQRYAAGTEVPQ